MNRASEGPEIVRSLFAAPEDNRVDSERRRDAAFGDRQQVDGPLAPDVLTARDALGYIDPPEAVDGAPAETSGATPGWDAARESNAASGTSPR